ncbi:MAG: hypothetical protein MH252_06820 [Thermosynechococcaceae cyanobacterium MS004]|nr:hypothetical protein [Thermosynechococcaceae cyanobacterium MS004]
MTSDSTTSQSSASQSSASDPTSSDPATHQIALDRLRQVRPLLLQLHKLLMEAAKLSYESNYGPILSKGDYFRLVVSNEWFQWLRPFSQFIVRIDERLAAKQPSKAENAQAIALDAYKLLSPVSQDSGAEHPYYQLMQQNPEIAMFHGQIIRLLDTAPGK